MQCRCSSSDQILHSGSMRELKSLKLPSVPYCPTLAFRCLMRRQKREMEQWDWSGGDLLQIRSSTLPDLALFSMKLSIWLSQLGMMFLFSFSFCLFLTSFLSLRKGTQFLSLLYLDPLSCPFPITFFWPALSLAILAIGSDLLVSVWFLSSREGYSCSLLESLSDSMPFVEGSERCNFEFDWSALQQIPGSGRSCETDSRLGQSGQGVTRQVEQRRLEEYGRE